MSNSYTRSNSWVRGILFFVLWFGLGAWGLDKLSARRAIICDAHSATAQCRINEDRLSGSRLIQALPLAQIKSAEKKRFGSTFNSPSTSTLVLNTQRGQIWISNDDLEGGVGQWTAESMINDYLNAKTSPALTLRAQLPSAFIVTASVFAAISILLLGAVLFSRQLIERAKV